MTALDHVLTEACARAGLNGQGAEILYARSNTVYKLACSPVVARLRYAPGASEWARRLRISVEVTAWLGDQGFPAVTPASVDQPVEIDGYLVTFWTYLPDAHTGDEDPRTLGRVLRRLHELPAPPLTLPPARPLSSIREDTQRCAWLNEDERSWILARAEDLAHQYEATTWTLGLGLIHCDAWADNLIRYRDGVVLADWDSVSYGPREQDIIPAAIRQRFGRPASEWHQFCDAYGVDPETLPGLRILRQMRELRTLVPYLRGPGRADVQAEVRRRITDIRSGTQQQPWNALNLASARRPNGEPASRCRRSRNSR
jgi:Ser/Thr protein kinase RdoA (MazF antagonist)